MKSLFLAFSMTVALASPAWALDDDDLLSLVAMPLAVAAVADLIEVSPTSLMRLVGAFNDADVSPPRFVELVRWAPIVLVDETAGPHLVQLVNTQVSDGVRGDALATLVANELRSAGAEIDVTAPRVVRVVDRDIIPRAVVDRVTEVRRHPHGGPPGQIKKELGVQTGAEVVHGVKPGSQSDRKVRSTDEGDRGRAAGDRKARGASQDPPGQAKKQGVENDKGKANSGGKAKGKGKGNQ